VQLEIVSRICGTVYASAQRRAGGTGAGGGDQAQAGTLRVDQDTHLVALAIERGEDFGRRSLGRKNCPRNCRNSLDWDGRAWTDAVGRFLLAYQSC
jgi:hypothetical protein